MTQTPYLSQVREVNHLAGLFGPAAIARLTGVPFRIALIAKGIRIAADGTVTDGQHRLSALFQLVAQ